MPPAARLTDLTVCPKSEPGPVLHVGGPIVGAGAATVLIGFMPAARMSDKCACVGPPASVVEGSPTVKIEGKLAARLGDATSHGGFVALGCPTVLIGGAAQGAAASTGKAFVAVCAAPRDDGSE